MEFQIVTKKGKGTELITVGGQPVTIPGLEGFQFAVHPSTLHGGTWTVSEVTSGLWVCDGADTAEQAIARARERLSKLVPETVKGRVAEAVAKYKGNSHAQ